MQKTRRVSLKYCHRDEVNLKREKENNEEEEEEEEEDKVNVKGGFFPKHIRQHTTHFGKDRLKMSMLSLKVSMCHYFNWRNECNTKTIFAFFSYIYLPTISKILSALTSLFRALVFFLTTWQFSLIKNITIQWNGQIKFGNCSNIECYHLAVDI